MPLRNSRPEYTSRPKGGLAQVAWDYFEKHTGPEARFSIKYWPAYNGASTGTPNAWWFTPLSDHCYPFNSDSHVLCGTLRWWKEQGRPRIEWIANPTPQNLFRKRTR
jgi:hypothetical protein